MAVLLHNFYTIIGTCITSIIRYNCRKFKLEQQLQELVRCLQAYIKVRYIVSYSKGVKKVSAQPVRNYFSIFFFKLFNFVIFLIYLFNCDY